MRLLLACCFLLGASTVAAQDCSGGTFIVSAVVVTGSAIVDIATAPASARRYNRQHLAIAPLIDPRRRSVGLSVSLSFGRSSRASAGSFVAPRRKSPGTAVVLSLVATVVPTGAGLALGDGGLFLGGLIIGPGVGHLYAEQWARAVGAIALRGVASAVGLWSIIPCFGD